MADSDSSKTGRARSFLKDRRGAVAIMFALGMIPIFAIVGGAIDFWRAENVKNRLQTALDAALLAAASAGTLTDDERVDYAKQVFTANYPATELGVPAEPNIVVNSGTVTGSVTADLPSAIIGIIGIDTFSLDATAVVNLPQLPAGEIVMVLDYSGSMGSGGKYIAMRDAAKTLIDTLSQNGSNSNVKFGLVPFSEHVYATMSSNFIINEAPGGTWSNCTRDRKWVFNTNDSTPVFSNDNTKWGLDCYGGGSGGGGEGGEEEGPVCLGGGEGEEEEGEGEEGGGGGSCMCNAYVACSAYVARNLIVEPLSNNFGSLKLQLDSMTPYQNTHIALGLSFGYHVLSPNEPWSDGVAYNTPGTLKAIVLLTDGQQTTDAWGPGASSNVARGEQNLEDLCENIKDDGVVMVTVAFGLTHAATETRLRNCATSPSHFFDANNNSELAVAFEEIAAEFAKDIYISQ